MNPVVDARLRSYSEVWDILIVEVEDSWNDVVVLERGGLSVIQMSVNTTCK